MSKRRVIWRAVGLVLFAVIVVVCFVNTYVGFGYIGRRTHVSCASGAFIFQFGAVAFPGLGWYYKDAMNEAVWLPRVGTFSPSVTSIAVPLWIPLLVIAGAFVVAWRRSRRPRPGYCRHCGYDLTGLTKSRCPECGREFGE